MTIHSHHLRDDRLFDCYIAARHGDAVDPPAAGHLADCEACGARYAELVRVMDEVREDGEAETDAVFTAERLRAQRHHIARRIEHVGRAGRVISFPHHPGTRPAVSTPRNASRWVAAAAAAGLVLGIALGASYKWQSRSSGPFENSAAATAPTQPISTATATGGSNPAPDVAADDAFLSDLEIALDRPRTSELQPLDVLTPHVLEIRDVR